MGAGRLVGTMASELAPSGPAAWLPEDVALLLDPGLRGPDGHGSVTGGQPPTLLRLSTTAAQVLEDWSGGEPVRQHRAFARGLVDRGMATPRPGVQADPVVVVPVRDRPALLEQLLSQLDGLEVLVVDDGSVDAEAVAAVAQQHGAALLRRAQPGGPAAARNAGLAATTAELVAFVDSDVALDAELLRSLAGAFIDPKLGAIAPRIQVVAEGSSLAERYDAGASPLDMGARGGPVIPTSALAYVPAAVLVARRSALGPAFDEQLRFGEDVDLVWQMIERGWLVRYEPALIARHPARSSALGVLQQRYDYASSAGELAARHPKEMAAMRLHPVAASLTALLALLRPISAFVLLGAFTASTATELRDRVDDPLGEAIATMPPAALRGVEATAGSALRSFGPALLLGSLGSRRLRRATTALLLLAHGRRAWNRRGDVGLVASLVGDGASDLAYAAGLWHGSARARTARALTVKLSAGWLSRRQP